MLIKQILLLIIVYVYSLLIIVYIFTLLTCPSAYHGINTDTVNMQQMNLAEINTHYTGPSVQTGAGTAVVNVDFTVLSLKALHTDTGVQWLLIL